MTLTAMPNSVVGRHWSMAVGDLDGDKRTDLVWRNSVTGSTALWLMNGLQPKAARIVVADPAWRVTDVADLDGDGNADLLWRNATTGATNVWLMHGLTFSGAALLYDVNWAVSRTGDFDGDGKADLLWQNSVTGAASIWRCMA